MKHENRVVGLVRKCVCSAITNGFADEFFTQKNFKVDFLYKIAFSIRRNKVALK